MNQIGFSLSYIISMMARANLTIRFYRRSPMPRTAKRQSAQPLHRDPRLLAERSLPDPEFVAAKKARRTVTVNLSESPLSWLHAHGHLSDRQLLAGEKLRGDYEAAQMGARTTMRWEHMSISRGKRGGSHVLTQTEYTLRAKQRFDHGVEALGRDLSDIAWRVICAGESIPIAEKAMGWPLRSGKLVLRIALDRLADYYRLPG
jgi:Domain of unknown function (DUF6456)